MAKIVARNGSLYIDDGATCTAISATLSAMALTYSAEVPEVTGFGEVDTQRIANGIRDWTFTMEGFWQGESSQIDETLSNIGAGGSTFIRYGPSGSTSGCVMYAACAVLQDYTINNGGVNEAVTLSMTAIARTGSLTRSTASW